MTVSLVNATLNETELKRLQKDGLGLVQHTIELMIAISATGSLSEAAAELGISQPRASQILKSAEQQVGVTLFERSSAGLRLTAAGAAMLPYVEQMLDLRRSAIEAARFAEGKLASILNVGLNYPLTAFATPFLFEHFRQAHPEVQLRVCKLMPSQLVQGLETSTLDVCLCFEPARTGEVVSEVLFKTDMVGVSSAALQRPEQMSLADFLSAPLVLPSRACTSRVHLDGIFEKRSLAPQVAMEIDDPPTLLDVVRKRIASTIMPRTVVPNSRSLTISRIVEPQIQITAVCLTRRNPSAAVQAFLQLTKAEVAKRFSHREPLIEPDL